MSEFLKPQNPLQHKDGAFLYPLTTADQVILEDNNRLNFVLEHLVYVDEEHQESAVAPVDADTLDGQLPIYYAPATKLTPKNLLDNSYFLDPVNQRGESNYNITQSYTIDRWIYRGTGDSGLWIDANGMTLEKVTDSYTAFKQCIDVDEKKLRGKTVTFAAKISQLTGTLRMAFAEGSSAALDSDIISRVEVTETGIFLVTATVPVLSLDYFGVSFAILSETGSCTLEWAALYEGEYTLETLPKYQSKGYAAELAECQRYYQRYSATEANVILLHGASNNQYAYFQIPIFVPMRSGVVPTFEYANINLYPYSAGGAIDISGANVYFLDNNFGVGIRLMHEKNAIAEKTPVALRINTGGYFSLSADIL